MMLKWSAVRSVARCCNGLVAIVAFSFIDTTEKAVDIGHE